MSPLVQVFVAVVYCLFSAGVVFGYAAIKPVFVKEGVYSEYCSSEAIVASQGTCYQQEIRYGLGRYSSVSVTLIWTFLALI